MAAEKSYTDMIKERDLISKALTEHLAAAHEKIADLQDEFQKLQNVYQALAQEDDKKSKQIVELKNLSKMIIDAESADKKLIVPMFHAWLHTAKALQEQGNEHNKKLRIRT